MGANDAGWTDLLAACYVGECSSEKQGPAVTASLATVRQNLNVFLSRLASQYGKDTPKVALTGYYQVFPTQKPESCTDVIGINEAELAFGRQLQTDISAAIKDSVSKYTFATYVPLDFTGHELCSSDPWVQGLTEKQPYHPTVTGQAKIAEQLTKALQ